ncbi:hypothetical protein YYC_01319 [Plasmodium yoelii 17X]|uniref:Zinc finger protein n=4 Tax=Plasmodium yoelii TaxID=5861 RepID=A0AAF0B7S6_PLAYO|nr:zinc finger protein, putative [Plasmodium yoelii]EAA21296.1 hypothetical protein [Plasmodium yoelii yoelii]ETB61420.1 hypothetical protein YYC_01319 [Plasmodium yoelii 17X]WBY60749.1 zinc finger protein [Plasmodium yoelii yoelii]CDU20529.1 conserved Plasmodium protein, unknown function [Plasmodium yoelii]VTZ81490.1 zinc finger protein, putative [Plasmodium yoelii]|eukprot:XP_729731.1 zinc finger protein, putative [Plasmodium yoelii]
MDNTWRCESCLVVNSNDVEECECCMQKRTPNNTNKTNDNNETTSNTVNDNNDQKVNTNENDQETKINENENEKKVKISTGEGGGFMPSVESTNNKNESESKSVFLTGIDSNKSLKNEENTSEDKPKNSTNKTKERKRADKRERKPSSRIQPARKCTQKKICYKT